jgi:hypothetical protein
MTEDYWAAGRHAARHVAKGYLLAMGGAFLAFGLTYAISRTSTLRTAASSSSPAREKGRARPEIPTVDSPCECWRGGVPGCFSSREEAVESIRDIYGYGR